jgi:hypothetical protein
MFKPVVAKTLDEPALHVSFSLVVQGRSDAAPYAVRDVVDCMLTFDFAVCVKTI